MWSSLLGRFSKDLGIDLGSSYMVGDSITDVQAGKQAGCKTIFVTRFKCDICKLEKENNVEPDFYAADLIEAASIIRKGKI